MKQTLFGPKLIHGLMIRMDRGRHPEDCPDDDVSLDGHLLRDGQARGHAGGHRHLLPRLPPARGDKRIFTSLGFDHLNV